MKASRFRMAVRIQRFEIWSCVLLVAVVAITALIVRARLDGVGAPVECLTPWIFPDVVYDAARCDPLNEAFFRISRDEAGLVMSTMYAVPLVVGSAVGCRARRSRDRRRDGADRLGARRLASPMAPGAPRPDPRDPRRPAGVRRDRHRFARRGSSAVAVRPAFV